MTNLSKSQDVKSFLFHLQQRAIYTFSIDELFESLDKSALAIRRELDRLTASRKVANVRRGFYLIITPEYHSRGMMPADTFMDQMMHYLNREYYFGLLSAAAFHGSAHQQPQASYVMTCKPALRSIDNTKITIHFPIKSQWPHYGIERRKTPSGSIALSSPALTMFDLLQYQSQSGGFDRVLMLIHDLLESIREDDLRNVLKNRIPTAILQRCGYLLDVVYKESDLADIVYDGLESLNYQYVELDTGSDDQITDRNSRWRININTETELEY